MLEIIREFLSKECRRKNITIEQLIEEYSVDETSFWNYVYNYDIMLENQKKPKISRQIKQENKRRKENLDSLEIYRSLKNSECTFGDIARQRGCTVDDICEKLRNEYLVRGIHNYSFDKLLEKNTELLKQKKEFQMYFYFIDHNMSFQELGKKFNLDEATIVYYFDSVVAEELSAKQIQEAFKQNRSKEFETEYTIQRRKLCNLFTLTLEETESIDQVIHAFNQKLFTGEENPIFKQYRNTNLIHDKDSEIVKKVETLHYIKRYLSKEAPTMEKCCTEISQNPYNIYHRLNSDWLSVFLKPEIIAKLRIRSLIGTSKVYRSSADKFSLIEYYMSLYATYMNGNGITMKQFQENFGENLNYGEVFDQKLNTSIFRKISKIMKDMIAHKSIKNKGDILYQDYLMNFMFFKDLAILSGIQEEELEKYFKYNADRQEEWKTICSTEQERSIVLNQTIEKLYTFADLMEQWVNCKNLTALEKERLSAQINAMAEHKFSIIKLEKQQSYLMKLARACRFTAMYLGQNEYEIGALKETFGITSDTAVRTYLYHELILEILDSEILAYLKMKRSISQQLGQEKGQQKYVENKTYLNKIRSKNGQFISKN